MKTNYKAVIIDDESDAREFIALLIREMFPFISVVGMADGVVSGRTTVNECDPDLLFLDIEMGDGTGLDLLSFLPNISCTVIFVTAYDQYAIQALRASAQDYLLKPINREEFKQAVSKAIEKLQDQNNIGLMLSLISNLHRQLEVRKIGIPSLTGIIFEDVDNVIFCEALDNYTIVYFDGKPKAMISKTLALLENELKKFAFFRIHHKYLVNLKKVQAYNKGKAGGTVIMVDKSELEVSVRRKTDLMRIIKADFKGM